MKLYSDKDRKRDGDPLDINTPWPEGGSKRLWPIYSHYSVIHYLETMEIELSGLTDTPGGHTVVGSFDWHTRKHPNNPEFDLCHGISRNTMFEVLHAPNRKVHLWLQAGGLTVRLVSLELSRAFLDIEGFEAYLQEEINTSRTRCAAEVARFREQVSTWQRGLDNEQQRLRLIDGTPAFRRPS